MQPATADRRWAIVLAGGDGTRLQELTREISGAPIPKQYCRIAGERSLLETTLARTQHYAPLERTLVIVNDDHRAISGAQLRYVPPGNVLVQPCNRDTGPGLLFVLLRLARRDPHAIVAVFPSDHYVGDDHTFMAHVTQATRIVAQLPQKIALLGIRPDRAETGYGYIIPGRPLPAVCAGGDANYVAGFEEKPTAAVANDLIGRGGLWNSFVMVFQLQRLLHLLRTALPEEMCRMQELENASDAAAYRAVLPWNFSSRFLTRTPKELVVVRVDDVDWSDWGTRDLIERTLRRLNRLPPWGTGRSPETSAGPPQQCSREQDRTEPT